MGQTRRVQGRSTAIFTDDDGWTKVVYHQTPVVSFNATHVRLCDGGWQSLTTKLRMNQASNQFRLGYSVSQKDFDWYVQLPDGREVPYESGMEFARHD